MKGEGLLSRGRTLLGVPGAVLAARARLKALNPHLVLGMGGHSSGPAGVAAWLLGIPLALHEQNAIPGATNRYLSRLAAKIFVSFPASRDFFPGALPLDRQPHPAGVFRTRRRPGPRRPSRS